MRVIPEVKINRHGRSTGKAGPGIGIELLGIGAVGQLHALRVGVIAVGAGIPGKGIALARKHIFSRLRAVRRAAESSASISRAASQMTLGSDVSVEVSAETADESASDKSPCCSVQAQSEMQSRAASRIHIFFFMRILLFDRLRSNRRAHRHHIAARGQYSSHGRNARDDGRSRSGADGG